MKSLFSHRNLVVGGILFYVGLFIFSQWIERHEIKEYLKWAYAKHKAEFHQSWPVHFCKTTWPSPVVLDDSGRPVRLSLHHFRAPDGESDAKALVKYYQKYGYRLASSSEESKFEELTGWQRDETYGNVVIYTDADYVQDNFRGLFFLRPLEPEAFEEMYTEEVICRGQKAVNIKNFWPDWEMVEKIAEKVHLNYRGVEIVLAKPLPGPPSHYGI